MTSVQIVTDSSCDLPEEVIAELNIKIVPLKIRFGETEFVDRFELSTDQFWDKCQSMDELPSTAAPAPGAFVEQFEEAASQGASGVVAIVLSGELSATIEAAQQAALMVKDKIEVKVVDSRTVTMGLGSIVVGAATAAQSGASIEEISANAIDCVETYTGTRCARHVGEFTQGRTHWSSWISFRVDAFNQTFNRSS